MHGVLYNEALLEWSLEPRTPLLIKAGGEGWAAIDPTIPDMSFVRTQRNGKLEVYIPGSSLRGVVRSYAERLLRSIGPHLACDPTQTRGERRGLRRACHAGRDTTDMDGPDAYNCSCYACRLFGNTALAGRVRISDFYLQGEPQLERRYGVAIDRVTGGVVPRALFELEILTAGQFVGSLTVRNFTLGQLGLLAAALLDMSDGLVPIGFGKSRGLGRVRLTFQRLVVRTPRDPQGYLRGVGYWASGREPRYRLPDAAQDQMAWDVPVTRERGFYLAVVEGDAPIRAHFEQIATRWPEEAEEVAG